MNNKVVMGVCLLFVLLLLVLGGGYVYLDDKLNDKPVAEGDASLFVVERGASVSGILKAAIAEKILIQPLWLLKLEYRLSADRGELKAGEYLIESGSSAREVLQLLRSGKVYERSFTFAEGLRFDQWLELLAAEPKILDDYSPDAIAALVGDISPEGLFFPDTYRFTQGATTMSILKRAHQRMNQKLDQLWSLRDVETVLKSKQELLVLASMIEKETGAEEDRILISSVFNNRLKISMRLQSDPTSIYGLENFDGNITRKHLRQKTPYNTYVIKGLPIAPICNPGLSSIQAALLPADTDYLYFVAKGDGTSQFSQTLAQHNRAVRKYQLKISDSR